MCVAVCRLIELEEGMDALDAAIQYKNDTINSRQVELRQSQILSKVSLAENGNSLLLIVCLLFSNHVQVQFMGTTYGHTSWAQLVAITYGHNTWEQLMGTTCGHTSRAQPMAIT